MTEDELATLRAGLPGCEVVALLDRRTGTVLRSDAALRLGQERLDQLADRALTALGPGTGDTADQAFWASALGVEAFAPLPGAQDEIVCAVFGPGGPVPDLAGCLAAAGAPSGH